LRKKSAGIRKGYSKIKKEIGNIFLSEKGKKYYRNKPGTPFPEFGILARQNSSKPALFLLARFKI